MKKFFLVLLGNILIAQTFAEEATEKGSAFAKAPWCQMPCGRIHTIVWSTLLGTIALQIVLLMLLPRFKKLKKWQKYTLYGILTAASIAVAMYILPPYLEDGFVIGLCFLGDPMGCE